MDTDSGVAPLSRSTSQLSTTSTRSVVRGHSVRARSRNKKLQSYPSSSASSIATSDKSLTSFPSLAPESPQTEQPFFFAQDTANLARVTSAPKTPDPQTATTSNLDSLISDATPPKTSRSALFEDAPLATQKIPGALHLADDEHIERLVARHGPTKLVRQVAEDLAHRDVQIAKLRRKADERERALRKVILECGLSNLELETRLRAVEQELKAQEQVKRAQDGGLSDMMNDAMHDSMSTDWLRTQDFNDGTLRARTLVPAGDSGNNGGRGTLKGWKDYLWGTGTSRKSSRAADVDGEVLTTTIRAPTTGERRPALQEDLFTPPDGNSIRSSSRASSVYSGQTPRKPSTSLASKALQLVAGKATSIRDSESTRGRSNSTEQGGSLRTTSAASTRTGASNRAASGQVGPKALMAMRRATPAPVSAAQRSQTNERWESMGTSPDHPDAARQDNYGPVEMDTIFSPEGQPPTLTRLYNNHDGSEYLTDKFGFIYDQRRKKRQREAAQVALQIKQGSRTEMLSGARTRISPNLVDDSSSSIRDTASDDRPETPTSIEDMDQGKPKRWQDYLKIATFPTELLSHTPLITASTLEVLEGVEPPKSPGLITSDERGFFPPASTTAAVNNDPSPAPEAEAAATIVHEDAEPVKLLLKQLSDVHDALQREKSIRWNEFLRKVRAERRREGEAAAAAAAAAAESRFQKAPVTIPEAKLTDGETIGIADLGVKGKVGRAKWNEFRNLVLGGIPVANRPRIWAECSGAKFRRVPGYYEDLVSRSGEDDDPAVVSQIEMDINRTLTDNIFFRRGPGVAKLSEVLRAYARRNPKVGYCQGMNLITANLLLIMPSAEETFWILVSVVEQILPEGYYDHSLMASRADQHVLRQYVTQVLPRLSQHLDDLSIELEALTFQWFLSVFTDCLSAEALFRVWDVVLCTHDGSTFLFQVALALLKLNEPQLLQCDAPAAVYTYINHQMTNHAISIDGLIQASEGLRRLVRREDVEERRGRAIEEERRQASEREELNRLRRTQQFKKAASAPALVTEASASGVSSPTAQSSRTPSEEFDESAAGMGLGLGRPDDFEGIVDRGASRTPVEEEASFGLGS